MKARVLQFSRIDTIHKMAKRGATKQNLCGDTYMGPTALQCSGIGLHYQVPHTKETKMQAFYTMRKTNVVLKTILTTDFTVTSKYTKGCENADTDQSEVWLE